MNQPRILVVEDEPQIRQIVVVAVTAEGCRAYEADCVTDALRAVTQTKPHLVILDLGLPGRDGLTFIHEVRLWSVLPILVLSARTLETDKIEALDAGADDYLTKPFSLSELRARLRALLRRARSVATLQNPASVSDARLCFGDIEVDLARHTVTRDGERLHLTTFEYKLLATLVSQPDRLLTQHALLDAVWGAGNRNKSHYLRTFIGRLRHKLEADPARPRYILTEIGVGYRFLP